MQAVREDNHEPTALIAHPRTFGELHRLKDTTNQPLAPLKSFNDLCRFPTANIPTDYDLSR